MNTQTLETPDSQMQKIIKRSELPLHCPQPGSTLWDSHPRVFIELEKTGQGKCPYCGTTYSLADN